MIKKLFPYVNFKDKENNSELVDLLCAAAESKHHDILKQLGSFLKDEAIQDVINTRNFYDKTPLMIAAENGHRDNVNILLTLAPVDMTANKKGETALTLAIKNGHHEIARQLIAKVKEENNAEENKKFLNDALILAVKYNQINLVDDLLNAGADPNINDENEDSMLTLAEYLKEPEIFKKLCSRGASPDHDLPNKKEDAIALATEKQNPNSRDNNPDEKSDTQAQPSVTAHAQPAAPLMSSSTSSAHTAMKPSYWQRAKNFMRKNPIESGILIMMTITLVGCCIVAPIIAPLVAVGAATIGGTIVGALGIAASATMTSVVGAVSLGVGLACASALTGAPIIGGVISVCLPKRPKQKQSALLRESTPSSRRNCSTAKIYARGVPHVPANGTAITKAVSSHQQKVQQDSNLETPLLKQRRNTLTP
jgi:hypothetical protein